MAVLDLRMPGLDGQEATTLVPRRNPETQVVVMSAFEDPESVRRCPEAGAIEHVAKGTGAVTLSEAVARAASIAHARRAEGRDRGDARSSTA